MAVRYRKAKLSKPIPVKLDEPTLARIEALALAMGEAKSTVMRFAMKIGLDAMERRPVTMDEVLRPPSGWQLNEGGPK